MCQKRLKIALAMTLSMGLLACSGGGGGGGNDSIGGGAPGAAPYTLRGSGMTAQPDSTGTAVTQVSIPAGTNAFQVVTSAPGLSLRVTKLQAPDGSVLFDGGATPALDGPGAFVRSPAVISYPRNPLPTIPPGIYTVTHSVRANRQVLASTTLNSALAFKSDSDLTSGTLQVNFVYLGSIVNSRESRSAIRSATETVLETLKKANIDVRFSEFDFPSTPDRVVSPEFGDPLFEQLGNQLPAGVNVFFAVEVTGLGNREEYYGRAGSVPCPLIPSPRSGIAIHIARLAGGDGEFDSDRDNRSGRTSEITILGETITHEIGRCLGINDSVTFRGDKVVANDGLDTPKCFSVANCQLDRGASENFMFPFLLDERDDPGTTYFSRNRVAAGQAAMLQLSPAVR